MEYACDRAYTSYSNDFKMRVCTKAVLLFFCFASSLLAEEKKKILILGDSHSVHTFGQTLDQGLRNDGFSVKTIARSSASPHWWYTGLSTKHQAFSRDYDGTIHEEKKTPLLASILPKDSTVVVALGTNMIKVFKNLDLKKLKLDYDCKSKGITMAEATFCMARQIQENGNQCIWVGPPQMKNYKKKELKKTYETLGVLAKGCLIIDSRDLTKYAGSDGTHYDGKKGVAVAKAWAEAVRRGVRGVVQAEDRALQEQDSNWYGRSAE